MQLIKEHKFLIGISCVTIIVILLIVWFFNQNTSPDNKEYQLSEKEYLRNYQVNEVIPITVDDEQMAKIYLAEYVSLIINDPQKAYSLLDQNYKNKIYATYSLFKKYIDQIKSEKFYKATLLKYEVKYSQGYKVFHLYDLAENCIIIRETSVMQYNVIFDNYTV